MKFVLAAAKEEKENVLRRCKTISKSPIVVNDHEEKKTMDCQSSPFTAGEAPSDLVRIKGLQKEVEELGDALTKVQNDSKCLSDQIKLLFQESELDTKESKENLGTET